MSFLNTFPTKNKTINISLVIVLSLTLIGLVIAKKQGFIGQEEIEKVSTIKVAKRNIIESVSASGRIQPEKEIIIAPDASGEIVGLFVKEGDSVKQGQLLLKINPDIYYSNLDRAQANLNSSKSNLASSKARLVQAESSMDKAENDFKRSKELHKKGVVSDADFEAAQSQYNIAKAEVSAAHESVSAAKFAIMNAEASVKEANDNLTKTAVYAPIDGTISSLSKELGERVSGASQFSSGTEVMRIANLNSMEAQVDVSENDIVKVKIGDTTLIEVDAYLGTKFKGIVTEIANSANLTTASVDQVTNFTVKIRVLQASYKHLLDPKKPQNSPFRPGMSASVEILTTYVSDVIAVPIEAVTTRHDTSSFSSPKNNIEMKKKEENTENSDANAKDEDKKNTTEKIDKNYVFIYKNGEVQLREVKIGIQDTEYFQILTGLSTGEEVVTAPYRAISKTLKNHQPVLKVDKYSLFEESTE